ncbi:hypothetical protein VDGE_01470 [Verticillium dahliae]|uniref:Zn(2)-C6 fungal-type domain-containing protein n=1 Tax=Verticillium dahliae TaxID=27337 RepID=A0A444RV96_VERDA|nr:hypothetical protein VDGE_01470 [Verticillium dahliae]
MLPVSNLPQQTAPAAGPSLSPESDGPQKPKRARTSKPKVKTGCHNCKHRRIKCDEKRPACTQCVRSRKECAGYPAPPRSARSHEVLAIAPKPLAAAPTPIASAQHGTDIAPRRRQKIRERERQHLTPPQTPLPSINAIAPISIYRPSANLPLATHEGLYFQLFRTHTANELSGYFDSVFWTRTVLQECHSDNAIRHAVVALGALYKTLEQTSESPPGSPSSHDNLSAFDNAMRHWEVAIRQYSEAINALVHMDNQDQRSNRGRLMASVLLACFDSFVGDHKQAIVQIQNGLGLLEKLRAERRQSFYVGSEEPVEQELITMFTRLAIQAKSYDMAFHFPQPYVIRLTPQSSDPSSSPPSDAGSSPSSLNPSDIPDRFFTLMEARLTYDKLLEKMLRFTETLFSYSQASGANNPMGILPKSLQQYGLSFKGQLDAWAVAFEPILQSRTAPSVTHQEKAGIAVLKMFHIMSQILYLMTFSDNESQFDMFQTQFKTIVDLALEVVGDEERRAAAKRCPNPELCQHRQAYRPDIFGGREYTTHHIKPSFSADLGIVPPLFVVATKCRNAVTRRQAIQLLRSSARREGMWDSELTARIGHWVTAIEEEPDVLAAANGWGVPQPSVPTRHGSLEFGADVPLGPGGNARWDTPQSHRHNSSPGLSRATPGPVPEDKRVMVRAVDFDLRARFARLQVGTRGIVPGAPDMRSRVTQIHW